MTSCPRDALVVKLLRSPHASALVEEIDTSIALKVPGVVAVYTWKDVPRTRFAIAGQTYPEPSPYDRLILDRQLRFVGDPVAIVAAENEKARRQGHDAYQGQISSCWRRCPGLARRPRTTPSSSIPRRTGILPARWAATTSAIWWPASVESDGDVEQVLADCDVVIDRTYHTKAFQQAMMETFRTYAEMDRYGRLHVISSTQIVFHVPANPFPGAGHPQEPTSGWKSPASAAASAPSRPPSARSTPPSSLCRTGRPAELIYTREESQIAGSPRHEMEIRVRLGASSDGRIRAHGPLYPLQHRRLR